MRADYKESGRAFHGLTRRSDCGFFPRCIVVVGLLTGFGAVRAPADGCFVFKWNKAVDINEPTQKAVVFYDSGREELLLQVKYEGSLEDFGWLIPTPNLPAVEEGKMEPFYELSQLTQRRFGITRGHTLGLASAGGRQDLVQVIEVKTVGAYEVSVLSAQDAGSLQRWLQAHGYSFPEGKSEIVEEYTRRGWYFVAAKIDLNKGRGFKSVSAASPKDPQSTSKARKTLQSKLSSGELHPLLISFDTPKAVFPLRISAVGGKPSEVSLYLMAAEPLLSGWIYGKSVERLDRQYAKWEAERSARAEQVQKMRENSRTMALGFFLNSFYSKNPHDMILANLRDYTQEDLLAMAREELWPMPTEHLGEIFWASPQETLQCLRLTAKDLPACARTFSRLRAGEWYLTKQVYTFNAAEMRDLEFERAFLALARTMSQPVGSVAAQSLAQLGPKAQAFLTQACSSTNPIERLNAVIAIDISRQPGFGDSLVELVKDPMPATRLHALRAAGANPGNRFLETVRELFRDPSPEVRQEATAYLAHHEPPERMPFYLALTRDPDPNIRMEALGIASGLTKRAPSDEVFAEALRLLKDPDENVQAVALKALYHMREKKVPREDLLPLLSSPAPLVSPMAHAMLRPGPPGASERRPTLSSTETARLLTNRVTTARLAGLKNLMERADAEAVELMLPLLTDTNKLVRNRAFFALRSITGQNVSDNDVTQWQAWWQTNKSSFRPRRTGP